MGADPDSKLPLKVVTLNKAFKLAESWVDNMSRSTATESSKLEFEGRPSRLGLGAKVPPNVKSAESTDPVERKLLKKLNIDKRRSSKNLKKVSSVENSEPAEEDNDEPESRTNAFAKKRAVPLPSCIQPNKKSK